MFPPLLTSQMTFVKPAADESMRFNASGHLCLLHWPPVRGGRLRRCLKEDILLAVDLRRDPGSGSWSLTTADDGHRDALNGNGQRCIGRVLFFRLLIRLLLFLMLNIVCLSASGRCHARGHKNNI